MAGKLTTGNHSQLAAEMKFKTCSRLQMKTTGARTILTPCGLAKLERVKGKIVPRIRLDRLNSFKEKPAWRPVESSRYLVQKFLEPM